jgi:hypothetical protein
MPRFFVPPVYATLTDFARLRGLWLRLRLPLRGLTFASLTLAFAANPEIVKSFNRDRLGQISGFVDVGPLLQGGMIRQHLQRDGVQDR